MKKRLFAGDPVNFEEACPDIEEIKIEGTEGSAGGKFTSGGIVNLNKDNLGIVDCSNPYCKDGGYQNKLSHLIFEMIHSKETSKEKLIMCEGSTHSDNTCLNGLDIKIEIKYKDK